MPTKIRLTDCLIWTWSGSWNPYCLMWADICYNCLEKKIFVQSFLLVFQSHYMTYILKLGENAVSESSVLVTRWEVCCFRCLKNSIWKREYAPGTYSFVGFRCLTAENLQCWLTEEGTKCFILRNALLVKGNLLEAEPLYSLKGNCKEPARFGTLLVGLD